MEELLRQLKEANAATAAANAAAAAAKSGWEDSELRAAALAAKLGALPLDPLGAGSSAVPLPNPLAMPSIHKRSPTHSDATCFLADPFCGWIRAPVTYAVDPTLAPTFEGLLEAAKGDSRGMGMEERFYALASHTLPPFVERVGHPEGDVTAAALLSRAALGTSVWSLPGACKPELHVRAAAGTPGQPLHCPGYNGELKTAGDSRALEQAVLYATMDMVRIFFPAPLVPNQTPHQAAAAASLTSRLFYTHPPMAYALVGYPYVAHLLALEWVGRVLVSPVSQPFFLGSPQHAAAVAALPAPAYAPPEVLAVQPSDWHPKQGSSNPWCVQGGTFRKLVSGQARKPKALVTMQAAYAALARVLPGAPPHLHLPASVRLLYGAHELLVEMPAVAGRAATEQELEGGGPLALLPPLAHAIAWLARRCIIYTDLRAPNVLVDGSGQPWLVDFDDCLVTPAPVATLQGYLDAVAACPGAAQEDTFAWCLGAGSEKAVVAALSTAFEEAAAAEG